MIHRPRFDLDLAASVSRADQSARAVKPSPAALPLHRLFWKYLALNLPFGLLTWKFAPLMAIKPPKTYAEIIGIVEPASLAAILEQGPRGILGAAYQVSTHYSWLNFAATPILALLTVALILIHADFDARCEAQLPGSSDWLKVPEALQGIAVSVVAIGFALLIGSALAVVPMALLTAVIALMLRERQHQGAPS